METNSKTDRRSFLGKLAVGTSLSIPAMVSAFQANAFVDPAHPALAGDADEWFKKVKGKHRIVYDAPEPHEGFPIIWTWVFYQTNNQTGTPDTDMTAVVVLRHNAIPFAMEDRLWEKYKFGEVFQVNDSKKTPLLRNPYWDPKEGDFPLPQIEGMKTLQGRGVMFCVCDMALTVYSGFIAQSLNQKPEDVKKDWVSGLHPGIQVVPSGVWAIGRAQENKCAYCFAG